MQQHTKKSSAQADSTVKSCDICRTNPAKYVVARQRNGVCSKQLVCVECAPGAIQSVAPGIVLPKTLRSSCADGRQDSANAHFRCSVCGTQLAEIITEAKPGCPACYSRFKDEFESIIESFQPGRYHVGKDIPL